MEFRNVDTLVPLENNPRTITPEELETLKESLKNNPDYFSARPLILSDRTGELVVIAGNQRLKAAKAIGMTEVPTYLLSGLTEDREAEIVVRDNVENGKWDIEKLESFRNKADLMKWGVEIEEWAAEKEPEIEETPVPEVDEEKEPITQHGDIWQLGCHRLMCGDSTKSEDVARLMDGKKADMVCTDPPYNVNVSNSKGLKIKNDQMKSSEFAKFINSAVACLAENVKPGGAYYIWYGDIESVAFRMACANSGLQVRETLIWVKNTFTLSRHDYHYRHEPCLYLFHPGAAHYFVEDRSQDTVTEQELDFDKMKAAEMRDMLKEIYANTQTTILHEKKPTVDDLHPTMKPIALFAKLIRNSSRPGELVLDTFGGSGTTIMACEQTGRQACVMELDPKYCDVIIKRWEEYTGEKAVKIG